MLITTITTIHVLLIIHSNYYILTLVTCRKFTVVFTEADSAMSMKVTGESKTGLNYVSVDVEKTSNITWCNVQ